ncbi:phage exclusion lipoprotein Cor [Rahnella victoriana]|uniref:phage exclusion lipoprotein Cor n=1 Tax=Rahnella victoriana TaxID=1510570 RepID=UPI00103A70EF|nr:cor protein [Rahnella victoriana]TBX35819.1 cor protein [Rahnella victoriana]
MMRIFVLLGMIAMVTACAGVFEKQEPVCTGTAMIGGQETSVQIYGVRHVANQTQYKAGDPFGWRWISKTNFRRTTCGK